MSCTKLAHAGGQQGFRMLSQSARRLRSSNLIGWESRLSLRLSAEVGSAHASVKIYLLHQIGQYTADRSDLILRVFKSPQDSQMSTTSDARL